MLKVLYSDRHDWRDAGLGIRRPPHRHERRRDFQLLQREPESSQLLGGELFAVVWRLTQIICT